MFALRALEFPMVAQQHRVREWMGLHLPLADPHLRGQRFRFGALARLLQHFGEHP